MKSRGRLIAILVVVCFCLTIVTILLYNPITLHKLRVDLLNAIKGESISILEVQSTYGKLNGSGNGTQFLVAVLVKGEETVIAELTAQLKNQYEIVDYMVQTESCLDIKYLEHKELTFCTDIESGNYYTVYLYESSCGSFVDIQGH